MSSYPHVYTKQCLNIFSCLTIDKCDMNYISSVNFSKSKREVENDHLNRSKIDCFKVKDEDVKSDTCDYTNEIIVGKSMNNNCKEKTKMIMDKKYRSKKWSNVKGYGTINVNSSDDDNNIHTNIHPYNRIEKLDKPYNIRSVNEEAWNMNKIKKIYKN